MKKIIIGFVLCSSFSFGQSSPNTIYLGQDENNYPIYKNIRPFSSLGSKFALGITVGGITAIITKIIVDRKREDEQRIETFEQEGVYI